MRAYVASLAFSGLLLVSSPQAGPSLQARIDQAVPGDIITVEGGVYHEQIVIDKALILQGWGMPTIDGGGQGDVVTITADDVTLSGFTIRGTSHAMSREPAAVKVEKANRVTVQYNRVEDAHFGIHLTDSKENVIADNQLDIGDRVPIEARGHAIYLWEVSDTAVHANTITNAGDGIHLEFSDHNGIGQNTVTQSRYALHMMYANDNRVLNNTFTGNLSGLVVMFSHDILVNGNDFSSNRRGATGAGMLLKDVDNIFAESNRLIRNKYGMTVEGTPQSANATAIFMRNLYALNDNGIGLTSNAPITFVENAVVENAVQVRALSGGSLLADHTVGGTTPPVASSATRATWSLNGQGNYWSDYSGYDADGNGIGDRTYRPLPPFLGALSSIDSLRLFDRTLAQQAIDLAARLFPIYRYQPVIEDAAPLMSPPGPALPAGKGMNPKLLVMSMFFLALVGAIRFSSLRLAASRPRRPARYGKQVVSRSQAVEQG